ncbi:MAG: hypothetical protein PF636_04205 [Actinomycetota bacterium]|jgi:hypothetical protein|nr:hypothetical protein [Actinomycetota bacterium]
MADARDYPWLTVTFMLILGQWVLALTLPSGEVTWLKFAALVLLAIWLPLEFLPFWHLKRYGEVPADENYMSTTRVVDQVCERDFGREYAVYQARVPLLNVAAGMWRRFGPSHTPAHGQ